MLFLESLRIAFEALKVNKLRSLLTMLGIIIGVASVILLVSIGTGLQVYITRQFETLGSNNLIVMPGTFGSELGSGGLGGIHGPPNYQGSKLTLANVRDLEKLGPPLVGVTPVFESASLAVYQKNSQTTTLLAVTDQYPKVRKLEITQGRFLSRADLEAARRAAVIGPTLAEKLFGSSSPVGKEITISDRRFEVVGVSEKLGSMMGFDIDNAAYIPITTAQKIIGFENLMEILVKVESKERIGEAKTLVENYFLRQMNEDDFSVIDQRQILDIINQILGVLTVALGGIAAISLLVGGIGIMNIMLVSVTERTREVGLRKAVGATRRAILLQFVTEAVILSLVGGTVGIILGVLGSLVLGHFLATGITFWSIILAFGVSVLVGIIFGVAPAAKASRLHPIEALRYE